MFPEFILYVRQWSEHTERSDLLLFLIILYLEKVKWSDSCLVISNSLWSHTVHGILEVWILEWVGSLAGKESFCNAGDPVLIPAWGISAGEVIGNPHQYSWASMAVQLVKNPLAMQKTWVWSLGWEDPLEKAKATHSSILAWRIPRTV